MTFSKVRKGARVHLPWGSVVVGKSHGQGDGVVTGVVLDRQLLTNGQAVVHVLVSVPGERQTREMTFQEPGGNAAEFGMLEPA